MYLAARRNSSWKSISLWSDGGSHLRSYIGEYYEAQILSTLKLANTERHWFVSCHGKAQADAHAGTAKRAVRDYTLTTGASVSDFSIIK